MNFFPPHQHEFLRMQLALVLVGIFSQRLLPLSEGAGRVPAYELLVNSPTIRDLLHAGKTRDLPAAMKEGAHFGNITFNQCLLRLFEEEQVSLDEAISASDRPDELQLEIRGITKGTKI